MSDSGRYTQRYHYALPPAAIAPFPAEPRDRARLLVYERQKNQAVFSRFAELEQYLPKDSVLVLNETRVVPARFLVEKTTGGTVELFYLRTQGRDLVCLARRPVKRGAVFTLGRDRFTVVKKSGQQYVIRPSFSAKTIFSFLQKHGRTPLPPYLKASPLPERARREKYQTVFARRPGSVAAPTASLHFTSRLLTKIQASGVDIVRLTLHVNLGTFAPLTVGQLKQGRLHAEEYFISAAAAKRLNAAKMAGKKIIAVGTTSCRALESAVVGKQIKKLSGTTDIFIRPPYHFKFVDGLITNFHVPHSSLLMLVAAMTGKAKLLALYKLALKKKMRFLSFGDGMLIV